MFDVRTGLDVMDHFFLCHNAMLAVFILRNVLMLLIYILFNGAFSGFVYKASYVEW
jgi:hypothetical protein